MAIYWANALICSLESRSMPIFHQSTYDGCITLKKAKEAIETWKEIYPGKMMCSWIEREQQGQPTRKICFNSYVDNVGEIDYKLPDRIKKYKRKHK